MPAAPPAVPQRWKGPGQSPTLVSCSIDRVPDSSPTPPHPPGSRCTAERCTMPWMQHTDLPQILLKLFLTARAFLCSRPRRHTDIFLHVLKLCHIPLSSFSHHQL